MGRHESAARLSRVNLRVCRRHHEAHHAFPDRVLDFFDLDLTETSDAFESLFDRIVHRLAIAISTDASSIHHP